MTHIYNKISFDGLLDRLIERGCNPVRAKDITFLILDTGDKFESLTRRDDKRWLVRPSLAYVKKISEGVGASPWEAAAHFWLAAQ